MSGSSDQLWRLSTERTISDLLRRHIRTCHPQKRIPPPQKSKACSPCHARKDRCEGGIPCKACQRRGVICVPARDEILNEQESCNDEPVALPVDFIIDDYLPDASSWIGAEYIDIYFDRFHPAWPFLHRGTFDFTKEPCVLVQSLVAIGLWVKGTKEAREASIRLHDKLCSAFYAQRVRMIRRLAFGLSELMPILMFRINGAFPMSVQVPTGTRRGP